MADNHFIKNNDISPGLRLTGAVSRWIFPYFKEKTFLKINKFTDHFMKGLWLSTSTKVQTVYLKRADGTKLRVLVRRSRKAQPKRAVTGLLWIHGGGYAIGLPEQDCRFSTLFTKDASCVAVLPDYTRSTEAPYPAALEDCYLTLRWMHKNAEDLGMDKTQLFVGGDSAGGGLTAALCLYARDKGEVPIAFQMPLYPMLDDREITKSSKNNDAPVWNTESNRAGWELYLKGIPKDEVPGYAAPARATDLNGLPPACTYVGTIEPFHDETVDYFSRLNAAGIHVHLKEFSGCFHAFDIVAPGSKAAKEARTFLLDTFKYAQEHYWGDPTSSPHMVR